MGLHVLMLRVANLESKDVARGTTGAEAMQAKVRTHH